MPGSDSQAGGDLDRPGAAAVGPDGVIVAELEKNSRERVRVRLTEYRGVELVDVRTFYEDAGEWKPGKGIALRRALLPELLKALRTAEKIDREGKAG